jgi:hypothetical protein
VYARSGPLWFFGIGEAECARRQTHIPGNGVGVGERILVGAGTSCGGRRELPDVSFISGGGGVVVGGSFPQVLIFGGFSS